MAGVLSLVFAASIGVVCGQTTQYYATPSGSNQQSTTSSGGSNPQTTTPGTSTNPSCVKGPVTGYAFDTPAQNGIWYQYMYGPPGITKFLGPNLVNCMELDRGIGWVYDSNNGAYMQATAALCRNKDAPHDCWGGYVMQNTTCDGYCYGQTRLGGIPGVDDSISFHWFWKLYLEPNFFYLRAGCFEPENFLTPGAICQEPGMSVWTRKMPKDITPLEDAIIRDAIDDRFQFMCVTSKDMVYNTWIYDLPPCDFPGRTQNYLNDQRYAEEHLVSKCASKEGSSCSPASFY